MNKSQNVMSSEYRSLRKRLSRCAILGKRLLNFYGCKIVDGKIMFPPEWECGGCFVTFRSWKTTLFGNKSWLSFNVIVKVSFPWLKNKLIMFSSLEELDIQLTLLGANHD